MTRYIIEYLPAVAEQWLVVDEFLQIVVAVCETEQEAKEYEIIRKGKDIISSF